MNWDKAIILYKFASRSRPDKFRQALNSILDNSNQVDRIKFIISIDEDDQTKEQYHKVVDEVLSVSKVMEYRVCEGTSKNKVDAINRDLEYAKDYQIIICMSDDMRFIAKGYDDIIRQDFAVTPNGDMCLHYPDQHQGERCMTLNITDRRYFERFGYIYNPIYESVECDLENQDVAKMLGKYRFVEKRIFNHLHPSFGDTQYDALYNKTEDHAVHNRDKATRQDRIKRNYDLIKTETGWKHPNDKPIPVFSMGLGEVQSITITNEPPFGVNFIDMEETNSLDSLIAKAEKSKKLKSKLDKKMSECEALAAEITALGLVKVEVSVTEEALK